MASPPHELFTSNAGAIERVIAQICRRHQVFGADAEDFASIVRLHLIEDNYAVLRRFRGRSSLASYLVVVITRQFQDWRNARWGKWRPSAEAKRLGETGVRLETLTVRDGMSLDEAHELLRTRYQVFDSRATLESLAARFPQRIKRSFVDDSAVETVAAPGNTAEDQMLAEEAATVASRAAGALTTALRRLDHRDRLIVKMRFRDNCQIPDIARALRVEAKPLYRHIAKLLTTLRRELEASGWSASDLATAWSQRGFDSLADVESAGDVRPFVQSGHSPALTGGHRD